MVANKGGRKVQDAAAISVSDAADKLGELTNRVAYGRETITLTRHGKPVARLVPIPTAA